MSADFESLLSGLSPADRKEIPTIPERYVKRALDGDWDGVAELYHPDAIQMPPDQPAVEGRDAIRQALSRTFGAEGGVSLEKFSLSIQEAEGVGELLYVRASYRLRASVTMGGEVASIELRGPYINLLRRDEQGSWRIYRQIYGREHPAAMPQSSSQP